MKFTIFLSMKIVFVFLVLSMFIQAQEADEAEIDSAKYESNNLYAIQFYLVNGLSVAGKKQLSNNSAYRFHLDLSGNFYTSKIEEDETNQSAYDTTKRQRDIDDDRDSQYLSVSFQYLCYPYKTKHLSLYLGVGPHLGYSRYHTGSESDEKSDNYPDYKYIHNYSLSNFTLGLVGLFGVETSITNYISLFAEYQITASHVWGEREWEHKHTSTNQPIPDKSLTSATSNSWNINLSKVKLGLAISL